MPRPVAGICWPHGGTVGHLSVTTKQIVGNFPARQGDDAIVQCQLVPAGKYRNGAARAWCRTHQHYWGVKTDLAALAASGIRRCACHAQTMGYVLDPLVLDMRHYASVVLACDRNDIRVQATPQLQGEAALDAVVPALAIVPDAPLFGDPAIIQVNITPPALAALAAAGNVATGCITCARCGHPHLDLGAFASTAHKRHYCGNCGHDATHSGAALVSNPLTCLLRTYGARLRITRSNVHGHTML